MLVDFGSKRLYNNILIPEDAKADSESEKYQIWEKYYFLKCLAYSTDLTNYLTNSFPDIDSFKHDMEKWKQFNGNVKYPICSIAFELVESIYTKMDNVNELISKITQFITNLNYNSAEHLKELENVVRFTQRDIIALDIILPQIMDYAKDINDSKLVSSLTELKKLMQTYFRTLETHVATVRKMANNGDIFKISQDHMNLIQSVISSQDKSKKMIIKEKEWNNHVNETLKRMNKSMEQTWSRIGRIADYCL